MAQGWLRHLAGDRYESFSAGAKPAGYVHPLAIQVRAEVGVDISDHTSKHLTVFDSQPFDCLITVCDHTQQACPTYAGAARQLHWSLDDPAHAQGSDEEKMKVFRRARDEIRARLEESLI
jgi:arsenate reductase (thioredoxin)